VEQDMEKYEKSELSEKMKTSLMDQIDNAYLSKKLATIVTELEVAVRDDRVFAGGLQNKAYTQLLQQYEFRSLLPKDLFIESPRAVITSQEIASTQALATVLQQSKDTNTPIGITLSPGAKMFLAWGDEVYTLDANRVDIGGLVDGVLSQEIRVAGYDTKPLLKYFYALKNPLTGKNEGQKSLF